MADNNRPNVDATKLSTIRLALEEKRRQMEMDKRKEEAAANRQSQKFGKAAFLQAINKVSEIYIFFFFLKFLFAPNFYYSYLLGLFFSQFKFLKNLKFMYFSIFEQVHPDSNYYYW